MGFIGDFPNADPDISIIPNPDDPYSTVIFDPAIHALPDHIDRFSFRIPSSPKRVNFYISKAENEKAIILGGSGLKNDFPIPPNKIKELNDAGYTFLWIALPNPARDHAFFEHYLHIAQEVLQGEVHPKITEVLNQDNPKIFWGHSTSAQIFYHLMRNQRSFDTLTEDFVGAALCSPYLRPPNAENALKVGSLALRAMAAAYPDRVSLETSLGASYYMLGQGSSIPPSLIKVIRSIGKTEIPEALLQNLELFTPTFFQMVELMNHAQPVIKDMYNKKSLIRNRGDFPILTITGKNDPYASALLNRKAAQAIDSTLYESPICKHAVPYEDPNFSPVLIAGLDAMLNSSFAQFSNALGEWDKQTTRLGNKFTGPPPSVIPYLHPRYQSTADNAPHAA